MADGSPDDSLDVLDAVAALSQERILYAAELAAAFSSPRWPWDQRRAKRFLKRSGIGFQLGGKAGKWVTTSTALAERYPQLWRLFLAREVDAL
jgi:hypothetical protein